MPRFRYCINDSRHTMMRDEDGEELRDVTHARLSAIEGLTDLINARMATSDDEAVTVSVHDDAGWLLYEATLSFKGRWAT